MLRSAVGATILVNTTCAPVNAQAVPCEIGSPEVERGIIDIYFGQVQIYRGATLPAIGPERVVRWAFYSRVQGRWVTPLLFRITGPDQYTLAAVGRSDSTSLNFNSVTFVPIIGSAELLAGEQYTFGYACRQMIAAPAPDTVDTILNTQGAIGFSGYNDYSDTWSYALPGPTLELGQVFGNGGVPLDPEGLGGRIYSAKMYFECACPADLTNDGELDSGDLSAFISAFLFGQPLADVTNDGQVDSGDLSQFIADLLAGC